MKDEEVVALAHDLIESTEVVQVWDDVLWLKVDRGSYNALYQHLNPSKFLDKE
jgi:hypothetical protein